MSSNNSVGGTGNRPPAHNPMPTLDRATLEAMTESIREYGVVVPVIKDQTGYVLDGNNRIAIAKKLGVDVPVRVHECTPEQRVILRVELNSVRRDAPTEKQWKSLVDSLRKSGYSDRVIAQAVRVDRNKVQRYKSPENPTDSRESVGTKVVGEDGKTRPTGGESAPDRVLYLIRASTAGLTADDLANDEVLCQFSRSRISNIPGQLRDRGLVEATGKRGRSTVWRAVKTERPVAPADAQRARKVERLVAELRDPELVGATKEYFAEGKELRRLEKLVIEAEKEVAAAQDAEAKRQAEQEKELQRQAKIRRDQPGISLQYWSELTKSVEAATEILARWLREFDNIPPVSMAEVRMLDRALDDLAGQLHRFNVKLHPEGRHTAVTPDDIIDL